MINDPLFLLRGEDLCAEGLGAATEYLAERLTRVWTGIPEIVKLLLMHKADVNARDEEQFTPLATAAEYGHVEVMEILVSAGADVSAKLDDGSMLLHLAAERGQREATEFLLAHGANIHARDQRGYPPLMVAAVFGRLEVVDFLLADEAEVNARSGFSRTALHYGAAGREGNEAAMKAAGDTLREGLLGDDNEYQAVVESLLAHRADPNARDQGGVTPLHFAAANGNEAAATALLAGVRRRSSWLPSTRATPRLRRCCWPTGPILTPRTITAKQH